jgi:hypothetical protein
MFTARAHHTAVLLSSGMVLVAGGMDSLPLDTTEAYDPVTRKWLLTASLAAARSHHAACLLPSGQVLVAGGLSSGSPLASAELFTP